MKTVAWRHLRHLLTTARRRAQPAACLLAWSAVAGCAIPDIWIIFAHNRNDRLSAAVYDWTAYWPAVILAALVERGYRRRQITATLCGLACTLGDAARAFVHPGFAPPRIDYPSVLISAGRNIVVAFVLCAVVAKIASKVAPHWMTGGDEGPPPPICDACGYSLQGLPPGAGCPECGAQQSCLEATICALDHPLSIH